jgi:outer membrane protein TolC
VVERLWLLGLICVGAPAPLFGQVLTLSDAVQAAEANNRAIQVAQLEHEKAVDDVRVARTFRLPVFSVTAFGSQPLAQLGVTLDQGVLGVYPGVGPIPGVSTTLESPLRLGLIVYATVAQPLTQQHKIGLGIELARVGVEAATEQLRLKRQSTRNEVRRLYYGIAQAESGRRRLQTTLDFLRQLDRETSQQAAQRVALRADLLSVEANLAQAEYELLKLDDPIQTQREQLNRLIGRDVDTPFEVDPSSAADVEPLSLRDASAQALESRPEIRLARIQVRKAEVDRRIKSAERIPDISLSLAALKTVNFSSVLPSSVSSVGIQATWDVFDWGRKRSQVEAKRDAEAQARLDLKETEALVLSDVGHQYRRVIEARKELELAKAMQSSSEELLRVTRNRFTQREALLSDVIKVQSSLAEADHRFTQALLDLATSQADFERAIGKE